MSEFQEGCQIKCKKRCLESVECIFAVSFHGNLPEILKKINTDLIPFRDFKVDVFRIFLNCHILNLWGGEGGSRIMYVPTNTMQLIEGGGGGSDAMQGKMY